MGTPSKPQSPPADLWREDVASLSAYLDAGTVSPVDLLDMYLGRCDRLQPILNAFSFIDRKGARQAAERSAARQKKGERLGPLDGIPVSIKDNLFVAGMPAEWGSRMLKGHVATRDDICVERLRSAGAVIIGKTTTPEFALLGRTENLSTGTTRNPWNPALTPGGSSGGAVAAVAAAMAPLAIGTDAGGSTRMPGSYTGVVGLRPSNGRIPRRYGFLPMALDFQAIGVIARTTRDTELLYAAVAGPDPRDPASLLYSALRRAARPRRLGWFTQIGDDVPSSDVLAAHAETIRHLAAAGCEVAQCEPPFDIGEINALWGTLTAVGAARAARKFGDVWKKEATGQIAGLVEKGLSIPAADYVDALDRLQAFRSETSAKWGDFDALVIPVNPLPAWPVETDHPSSVEGRTLSAGAQGMYCGWVNAMGYGGISVPARPSAEGLPIGVQIVAPLAADDVIFEIAHYLEKAAPWSDRWPELALQT